MFIIIKDGEILGFLESEHGTIHEIHLLAKKLSSELTEPNVRIFIEDKIQIQRLIIYSQTIGQIINGTLQQKHLLEYKEVKDYVCLAD
jgi:hypothetical protein